MTGGAAARVGCSALSVAAPHRPRPRRRERKAERQCERRGRARPAPCLRSWPAGLRVSHRAAAGGVPGPHCIRLGPVRGLCAVENNERVCACVCVCVCACSCPRAWTASGSTAAQMWRVPAVGSAGSALAPTLVLKTFFIAPLTTVEASFPPPITRRKPPVILPTPFPHHRARPSHRVFISASYRPRKEVPVPFPPLFPRPARAAMPPLCRRFVFLLAAEPPY
jgi:hypothetical protein